MSHDPASAATMAPVAVGAAAQVALAAWLYHVAPRDPRHISFALLLVTGSTWDVAASLTRTVTAEPDAYAFYRLTMYAAVTYLGAIAAFMVHYPQPRATARTRRVLVGGLIAGVLAGWVAMALLPEIPAYHVLNAGEASVIVAGSILLVNAWRSSPTPANASTPLVATAFLLYSPIRALIEGVMEGNLAAWGDVPPSVWMDAWVLGPASLVLLAASVLLAWRHPHLGRRGAAFLAILVVGAVLGHALLLQGYPSAWGLIPISFGGLIAYALVRHKLLDVDVKLRWGISRGTIAAVFIAVFFIVSEAAQQFFGDALGSNYVGILAAGALVFALAPLSRIADGLAARAVPPAAAGDADGPRATDRDHETVYQNALRIALRDRDLTREEEAHLHRLAEALAIRPGRAHELLAAVERENRDP